jgi:hypothetical protein
VLKYMVDTDKVRNFIAVGLVIYARVNISDEVYARYHYPTPSSCL